NSLFEAQLALTPAKVSSASKTCRSSLLGSYPRDTKSVIEVEGFRVILSSLERHCPLTAKNSTSSAFKGVWHATYCTAHAFCQDRGKVEQYNNVLRRKG
ncbi:LOW QUALITY PROTEIN: hypothetical protein TorRG33x02_246220, partial [Trema orientale]